MTKLSYHVVKSIKGDWSVRKSGSSRALKSFSKKATAVKWGAKMSKDKGVDLFVHNKDGTIAKKRGYADFSTKPKGKD